MSERHNCAMGLREAALQALSAIEDSGHRYHLMAAADALRTALAESAGAESVVNQQFTTELSDEECDKMIIKSGLPPLACAVPQNLALLRGLCRAAARRKG